MGWNTTVLNKLEEIKDLITGSGSGGGTTIDLTILEGLVSDINDAIIALPTPLAPADLNTIETLLQELSETLDEVGIAVTGQVRSTPVDAAVALTDADTEYSFSFPNGTKGYTISIRGGVDTDTFRLAWATGKVATPTEPYRSYPQNVEVFDSNLNLEYQTLYIASSAASKVAQIEYWA